MRILSFLCHIRLFPMWTFSQSSRTTSARLDDLDMIFGALSHPTRRAILLRLRSGPASVGELAEPFHVTQQAISKQITVLRTAGLVEQRKQGRASICTLRTPPLEQVAQWVELYRSLWEGRFDKLADYLARPRNDS